MVAQCISTIEHNILYIEPKWNTASRICLNLQIEAIDDIEKPSLI